jgi:hypothetical protein
MIDLSRQVDEADAMDREKKCRRREESEKSKNEITPPMKKTSQTRRLFFDAVR